jgi:hypothetical protein
MTTRAKAKGAILGVFATSMLNIFSWRIGIPPAGQWVVLFCLAISVVWLYLCLRWLRRERAAEGPPPAEAAEQDAAQARAASSQLLLIWAVAVAASLAAPFWMPYSQPSLGVRVDFAIGLVTAAIASVVFGLQWRRRRRGRR